MNRYFGAAAVLVAILGFSNSAFSQAALPKTPDVADLPWVSYPSTGEFGDVATVSLKDDLHFLASPGTSQFLEINGNPAWPDSFTLLSSDMDWFAIFNFEDTGYVKDDEKIDPVALLATLKEQNQQANAERKDLKLSSLTLTDWAVPPHYDTESHRLEWGTKLLTEEGDTVVNYTVRLLGRGGIMTAILVSEPELLENDVKAFHTALGGFDFKPGKRYSEWLPGDKVAEYGLTALIVGGAAAAAVKSGFLKPLMYGLFAGGVALLGAISAFFRRMAGRFKRK